MDTLVEDATKIDLEDTEINQYYLEQNQKAFKESIDNYLEDSSNYEVALKKALRDTIDISNALYSSYFDLEEPDYTAEDFYV